METNVPHRDSSDQVTVQDAMGRAPLRQRFLAPVLVAGGIGLVLMAGNALASFVTSSVGTGSAVSATATPALDQVFSPNDNAAPTFADTMNALYSCLVNSQTCNANQRTAAIDMNNDGVLSNAEILAALSAMSCLSSVPTQDKYARAVITEIRALSDLSDCSAVQTKINNANGYAVDAPVITDPSSVGFAQFGSTSSQVSIVDGAGNAHSSSDFSVSYSLSVTGPGGGAVTDNWFEFTSSGTVQLTTGTDIADIPPGAYTINVTVADDNPNTYGLTDTQTFTLNINNQQGCIVNDSIAASDFSISSNVSGARVTISANHNSNDQLFVRTAGNVSTAGNGDVTYSNFGYSGVTATYDVSTGELEFSGNVSVADWAGIFRLVGYDYSSGTPSNASRTLIYSLSSNVAFNHPDGGAHFYTYVADTDIKFQNARTAAAGMSLFGLQGIWRPLPVQRSSNISGPKSAVMAGLAPATGLVIRPFAAGVACHPRMFQATLPASRGPIPAVIRISVRVRATGTGSPGRNVCNTCSATLATAIPAGSSVPIRAPAARSINPIAKAATRISRTASRTTISTTAMARTTCISTRMAVGTTIATMMGRSLDILSNGVVRQARAGLRMMAPWSISPRPRATISPRAAHSARIKAADF